MKGRIFDIKRFAVHDGPGIRTTVFFTGCPLDCPWCHNPESLILENISGNETAGKHSEIKEYSPEELFGEILKDELFFDESGGGVTFSGGEPFSQFSFLLKTAKLCRSGGIHTAIDTTGFVSADYLIKILPYTNLFLFDIKIMNRSEHKKFTGADNGIILSNLEFLFSAGADVRIRIPLIPGITDTEKNINEIIDFINSKNAIPDIDILPFNEFSVDKYKRLNRDWNLPHIRRQTDEELELIKLKFNRKGLTAKIGG